MGSAHDGVGIGVRATPAGAVRRRDVRERRSEPFVRPRIRGHRILGPRPGRPPAATSRGGHASPMACIQALSAVPGHSRPCRAGSRAREREAVCRTARNEQATTPFGQRDTDPPVDLGRTGACGVAGARICRGCCCALRVEGARFPSRASVPAARSDPGSGSPARRRRRRSGRSGDRESPDAFTAPGSAGRPRLPLPGPRRTSSPRFSRRSRGPTAVP